MTSLSGWSHLVPSLVILKCLDLVPHCPVQLVSIVTLLSFEECFGFHIVTLSHSKMGTDFSEIVRKNSCCCPSSGLCPVRLLQCLFSEANGLSLWEVLCHCPPVTLRLPLVAIDPPTSAASSTFEASRLCRFLSVQALCRATPLIAVDAPCFLLPSFSWPSSGCQIHICCDPSSSRSGVCVVRDRVHFGLLDDHISNCHHLPCAGYVHQVSVVSFRVTHQLSFQCVGDKFADVSVPLHHEDCNQKYSLLIESFYTSYQLCWTLFFSCHNQVSDPCCVKNRCSPHLGKSWVNEQASYHLQQCLVAHVS